jgi:ABC-type glycerol-3-phosphate transport system permease component
MKNRPTLPALSVYALLLLLGAILFGFPMYWMIRGAIISQGQWTERPMVWFPRHITFDAFRLAFAEQGIVRVVGNTFLLAILTMICNVFLDTLAGFSLAKMSLPWGKTIYAFLLVTIMVPFEGLMVPLYLIMTRAGLTNTLTGLVLPGAASAFCIILMRQFFSRLPTELIEAARMDGASWFRIFFQVAVPLAAPAIATIAIITFMAGWEAFVWPLLITDPQSKFDVVQKVLAQTTYNTMAGTEDGLWPSVMAIALIATLPVMVIFIAGQRFFMSGLTAGAVKG